jgi:hypothetical protein
MATPCADEGGNGPEPSRNDREEPQRHTTSGFDNLG